MFRFIIRRLIETIPVLFVILTATFFMIRLVPGGPFTSERALPPEVVESLNAYYGLDRPVGEQYARYLWNLCPKKFAPWELWAGNGADLKAAFGIDLGYSTKYTSRTINEIVAAKLPVSLELGAWALLVALGVGLPLGILAAVRNHTWLDHLASTFSMLGICVPTFVMGPLLVLVFAIWLRWLPPSGWYFPADRTLPAITLGLAYAAYIARLTRGGLLEVLSQDFIRTARAKGASERRVVLRHALRSGLQPVVAFLGPATAGLISGSFVIEVIFQIPGLGREFVNSAFNRDQPLILGTVLLYALMIIVLNFFVDVAQVWLNPRSKQE